MLMPKKAVLVLLASCFNTVPNALGQSTPCPTGSNNLACLLSGAFTGAVVGSTNHNPSFPSGDFSARTLTGVATGVATQLTSLPIPSSASGFTYTWDPAYGVYSRTAQSFGPILTERAETIGKNKLNIGFSYQRFALTSIDGLNLHSLGAVFTHNPDPTIPPSYLKDVVTSVANEDLNVAQYTAIATYGVTNRVDVSVAIPIIDVHLGVVSTDTIQRIGTGNATNDGVPIHYFGSPSNPQTQQITSNSGSAHGLGDIVFRAKGTVASWEHAGLAVGADVRVPTGDEYNLLGSGAIGIRPYLALSLVYGRVSPHANLGYQWNGKTVLAGDPTTGYKRHLPSSIPYALGTDVGVAKYLTLNFDILGQRFINLDRILSNPYTRDGQNFPDISFARNNTNVTNGAAGFKLNPAGRLLLYFNLLFKMNDAGLRSKVAPLFGLTYTF